MSARPGAAHHLPTTDRSQHERLPFNNTFRGKQVFMHLVLLCAGLALFCWISWAVRYHFVSENMPFGMKLVSLFSVTGILLFCYFIWNFPPNEIRTCATSILFMITIVLFRWSLAATRGKNFGLAFDPKTPAGITALGPYRYIRHPFYTAYILYWLGCAIATGSELSIVVLGALSALYTIASVREERMFLLSAHAEEYKKYKQRTGHFWPKKATS